MIENSAPPPGPYYHSTNSFDFLTYYFTYYCPPTFYT